jgi:fatty-acyl-CoA synthase
MGASDHCPGPSAANLSEWIAGHANRTPDKIAIRFDASDWSYAALAREVERLAAALAAGGVARGATVALLGLNSPREIALLAACARLGALFMPLNWRLAAPEHREMLAECAPAALFVEAAFVAQSAGLAAGLRNATLVALTGPTPVGWLGYDAFVARGASRAPPQDPEIDPETPLLICYTSGSTGAPKGVLLSQQAVQTNARHSAEMHALTAQDLVLTTLPLFHVGGLNNQTTPALRAGATVVLHRKFDVDAAFDAIEREGVTLTVLVPAQLMAMIAHPRWARVDLSGLRMITTGSTIVPERVIDAVHGRGVPLVQIYGSTETCPIAAYLKPEDARRKAGSAGRAARDCELRIVDEGDRDVAPGAQGEILVRGSNVMSGYWNQPQATAMALAGGWFHSGDIGHFDADGYLWIDGRKKDMIISGGENIAPAEIENVLLECSEIAEASVVGQSDERWGEIVVAVVVPAAGCTSLTRERVLALLVGRIARYKHPKRVLIVPELPKTPLGKVRKDEVRRLVAGGAAKPALQDELPGGAEGAAPGHWGAGQPGSGAAPVSPTERTP